MEGNHDAQGDRDEAGDEDGDVKLGAVPSVPEQDDSADEENGTDDESEDVHKRSLAVTQPTSRIAQSVESSDYDKRKVIMTTTENGGPARADLRDALTSIRATHEDQRVGLPQPVVTADPTETGSGAHEVGRFNTESADTSDDELDQPDHSAQPDHRG